MNNKLIRIGHSPDADDAFIFFGLARGLAKIEGFEVEHIIEPIESLNYRAMNSELEVTAVSAHAFAHLTESYALLSCGGSFGRGYGPVVVSPVPMKVEDLRDKKVAVPGALTTAYLLAQIYLPPFEPVQVSFEDIFETVKRGDADAGVVIHEGQITFGSQGFHKVLDLGEIWARETTLPLPLGLDVVRKDLGQEVMIRIWRGLKESISAALSSYDEAMEYALQFGRGIDRGLGSRFVSMYANKDTEEMGDDGEKSIKLLFEKGAMLSLMGAPPEFMVIRGEVNDCKR